MNSVQAGKIDFDLKIREADAYHSHGLLKEALGLYKHILSAGSVKPDVQKNIEGKIVLIKNAIEEQDKEDEQLSQKDIAHIKGTWSPEENVHEILSSASAFKELGMYKEAVTEYNKLFKMDYPNDILIPDLAECLFAIHSPSRVIDQIESIIQSNDLSDHEKVGIKFQFGMEMEKREHNDLAIEFYNSVKEIDPEYTGIDTKISSLQAVRSFDSRYSYLLESKIVTTNQLQNALAISKKSKMSVEHALIEQFRIDKEEIGKSLSFFYKCPFKTFEPNMPVPYELLKKLKKVFLIQNSWVPLSWEINGGIVNILIDDPRNLIKSDSISTLIKAKKINLSVGIKEDIEAIIKHFFDAKACKGETGEEVSDESFDLIPDIDFEEDEESEENVADGLDEGSSQVVRTVDQVLISAYRKDASDIHIEPSIITKKLAIRFRIDGVCQDVLQVPISNARGILSRLKIMSGLDIAEKRLPQDGKIKFKRKGVKPFELRIATLPTTGGYEDAVLRILAESGAMKLDDMGINKENLNIIKKIIAQPYGLFLVVGPTGSGKTTTLHSALGYINKPGVKIWTAEDPVEITQHGLRQVECKSKIGLDFARIMRAFLRADPDIIMIGEMRDLETASIGIEASLTGHLVFSTLHTNSAPETVTRLLDMGLNPLNFSDAFLGVLAQRLVRRLCKKCRKKYHPSEEEFEDIIMLYGKECFESSGIQYSPDLKLYRTDGCDICYGTGYKGRLGIHELMEGTKTIKRMIKKEATSEQLFAQAAKDGMTTLIQDGIAKVFEGLTDINEIKRVCVT